MNAKAQTHLEKQLIWDWPVRVCHWLLVLSFAGAWLTAESERWRLAHVTFGYTMFGLVVFRLMWGVVGTRYARFTSFVRGHAAVLCYTRSLLALRPQAYAGHNPVGALAILLLLALILVTASSGYLTYNDLGGDWAEELHEITAGIMLAAVSLHVLGVTITSLLHRENLVTAMISGRKIAAPGAAIRWPFLWLGLVIFVFVLGFWWSQWQTAAQRRASVSLLLNDAP
jgi:cytochrome b